MVALILIRVLIIFGGTRASVEASVAHTMESTALVPSDDRATRLRAIVTQDDCVHMAKEVSDGAFYKLPILAHALVHHLCDEMPPNATVHEATQHIAQRGVGVLQKLPIEPDANRAANPFYRVHVLLAAICGIGLVHGIALSASMLLLTYKRCNPTSWESRVASCTALAWIARCAYSSMSIYSRIDVALAVIAILL